jgi:glycosyltransferase involved in cell wall biosynthesis
MLQKALASVSAQTCPPEATIVSYDHEHGGHAHNRNKAMAMVNTEWVAFLDDDDVLLPHHLEHLINVQAQTGADLVYPWHTIVGPDGKPYAESILEGHGDPFDAERLRANNFIPVTVLVRSSAIRRAGGFPLSGPGRQWWKCEDWGCWISMLNMGYKFVHTPEITWEWHHWGGNLAGQGDQW